MSSQKLGRQFILPRPCHLNFPLNTRWSAEQARHVVVISVLPHCTVIYTCCPRDHSKQRCFRFNSDCTPYDNADPGPNQRFCRLSSTNIASHTQRNGGAGTNELDDKMLSPSFFFYIVPSSAKICWSYVVFLVFRVKQPVLRPRSFRFFSRSVFVPRPFFSLVTASRTRI